MQVALCSYLPFQYALSGSLHYKWGLVGYMGAEILATNGKFVFSTPIARDRQTTHVDKRPKCFKHDNYFCEGKERLSGSIALYDLSLKSYKIGMHTLMLICT